MAFTKLNKRLSVVLPDSLQPDCHGLFDQFSFRAFSVFRSRPPTSDLRPPISALGLGLPQYDTPRPCGMHLLLLG